MRQGSGDLAGDRFGDLGLHLEREPSIGCALERSGGSIVGLRPQVALVAHANEMGNQADPGRIALHLGQHDVVGVEFAADALEVAKGPGLMQCGGVPDDAEGRDPLGRREARHRRVRHAARDPVEVLHPGLVVEGHDGDPGPSIDRRRAPGAGDERDGHERESDERGDRDTERLRVTNPGLAAIGRSVAFSMLAGPHPRSLSRGDSAPRSGRRRCSMLVPAR